ncbi:methyltransferase [Kaistia defluvii]|uniref:tRNA1(Val) (adenine(37)-N6)-methyltransferase n=1 Tax=Kaistia defluvii TaxID=410841 RepID=UPI00225AB67B|nr:methyltransferase [Kaistia defluvii]MCX5520032.1 methyltransferase [Kaistia defluvii]
MLDVPLETTVDAFLGGRVEAIQPARGHHRSGLDAVFLAAAMGPSLRGRVIDMGAGAGVAGLSLAARADHARLVLAEREAELVACAEQALTRPANAGFADRVEVVGVDLLAGSARQAAALSPESFDHALMNPPFHDHGRVRASPDDFRARAHVLERGGLDDWFRAAAALVRQQGTLAAILPADRLPAVLAACDGRFGGLAVLPLHPRAGEAANRVLVRGTKGSRAAMRLLPGLVLHGSAGSAYLAGPAAILREGASIVDIHPVWSDPQWGETATNSS